MAEIYLGEHESSGQVAVKVMRGLLEKDPGQLARFKREAEVVAELKHPNIVHMIDYTLEDEVPCLVMEYVPGPSLAVYMKALHERKQRIPIIVVAQILKQLASALDYAHSNSMIHRDIKPANVLLRSPSEHITIEGTLPLDVETVLTDFGLVRLLDSTMHTTTGSVSGTPAYMSPEQARGEKVDHHTDIYSLGIMLYEMLAGGVPFQADTTFGMLMKHINDAPPPIKGLSADMNALLDRALAKDPSLRYESAGALANEFMALFNGQTISPGTLHIAEMARKAAEAGNQPKQPPEPPRRLRWLRLGAEVVLVGSLLAVIVFSILRPSFNNPVATPVPENPDIHVGILHFDDFNNVLDWVSITLSNAKLPEAGMHYEGWLVSLDGVSTRKIGPIPVNDSGAGQITFTNPDQKNLFQEYDQIIITLEPDGTTVNKPTGQVAYSSVFPTESLIPIRKLLVTYEDGPEQLALIQGLWYYSGSWINISIAGDQESKIVGLREAWKNGDESTVRMRTEEIINQIVGSQSNQFLDYDGNGKIDNTPGDLATDGFGSFPNGNQSGYIKATIEQAQLASEASDSTPNIRENSEYLQICVQNMDARLKLILRSALKLIKMPFGPDMEATITDLETLANTLMNGNDTNGDPLIEPIAGECGATDAYAYALKMADLLLFPGENRIPPSGK